MVKATLSCLLAMKRAAIAAGVPALGNMGDPFEPHGVEIFWQSTTRLPAILNVYQTEPKIFPEAVISNLVTVAGFKEPKTAHDALKGALRGKTASYQEPGTKRYLRIAPDSGHILYQNFAVIALPRESSEGVPEKGRALELALKLLPLLGLNEAELARKPDGKLQLAHVLREQGRLIQKATNEVKRTVMQGIVMGRSVEGVPFNGRGDCGGVRVSFGSHEQMAELQVVWPNLKASRRVFVADEKQILKWVKEGQAVIEHDGSINTAQIKELTITEAIPYYLGQDVTERQKTVYPYAVLKAKADAGVTNVVVHLSCPIFK